VIVFFAILGLGYVYAWKVKAWISGGALTDPGERHPFLLAKLDQLISWSQKNSLWPFGSGLAAARSR